jgi:mono/diheme cytochrome c family protein
VAMDEQEALTALFPRQVQIDPLVQSLREAGISEAQVSIMTPLPLSEGASVRLGSMPLYVITMIAGLVGIAIGIFFAGGTAAMYPLMTGGKPIVGAPIVGIISYETMMLLAIVVTFITSVVTIKRAHRAITERDSRVDDGYVMVRVSLSSTSTAPIALIRNLLQQAGSLEIQWESTQKARGTQSGKAIAVVLATICLMNGCSRDMQEQPSYEPQEAPRLHSPLGAVPRDSRAVITGSLEESISEGGNLFRINCSHCHGTTGRGDGPAAAYLKEKPADLHKPEVQTLSDSALYDVLTRGKDVMPPFKGELSAKERRSIVAYVKSLPKPIEKPANHP